ncbi:adhesion protein [Salmonella enterica]|nr:adhesion protein [Salmonella enterica]EDW2060354.1 adhesion protein [Salmonella enterica subsp. enterica serovar Oslo]EBR4568994.1 adhesion protein [Salmonella enterica]EBR5146372.1 adhesion protein [Salmonella enterica]EDY5958631.1 adhesion protein [Salmonella enterica]
MNKLRYLKTWLSTLVMLLTMSGIPAYAALDDSYCNTSGNFSIKNVNLKGGKFSPGQELQTISIPVTYRCKLAPKSYGGPYQLHLNVNYSLKTLVEALDGTGLGFDLKIDETGGPSAELKWADILQAVGGWNRRLPFGKDKDLPAGTDYNSGGTLTLRLFVNKGFTQTLANFHIPSLPGIAVIPFGGPAVPKPPYDSITTSAFNVRFIPENSGNVIVNPPVVRMGHFYASYKETLSRQVPFTVTAQQNTGTGLVPPFIAPLNIKFKTNDLQLADNGRSVVLYNTKGQATGMKLSVSDMKSGESVIFDTAMKMGDMNMGSDATGSVVKNYIAKVETIPGEPLNVGEFSAAMTVVVTYI